jgi:hypothetical protein
VAADSGGEPRWRVNRLAGGYGVGMNETQNEPTQGRQEPSEAERDLAEHERPDRGLVGDKDLPEDLQPTEDNPLAKNPGEDAAGDDEEPKAEGMPDLGDPGAPA